MRACVVRLVSRACLHEKGRCGPAGDWPEQVRSRSKRPATPCRLLPRNKILNRDHEFFIHAIRPLRTCTHPVKDLRPPRESARISYSCRMLRQSGQGFGFTRTLEMPPCAGSNHLHISHESDDRAARTSCKTLPHV